MTEGALGDVGERRLVREVVSRYVEAVGDDCGLMEVGTSWIAVTTDPVPRPAALLIGGDDDLFWVGWLLVTINASDLAASGADPLAFVAAMEAPPTLGIDGLERLLAGC